MTMSRARGVETDGLNDLNVAEYLETNPDFFERNGPLLAKLRLPHARDTGVTVSLVERQVEVLRDRNKSLDRRLKDLVDVARANDALADRIHRLSQRLIRATDLPATITAVETSLREDFDAMHPVLVLFLDEARRLETAAGGFMRADDMAGADILSFEPLLRSGRPRCGQIRDSQREYLFREAAAEIASVALTPLGTKGALGILAIGAGDAQRFHPAMSTEFLSRIGELVTDALTR